MLTSWSSAALRRLIVVNVLAQIGIVITGGIVRLTSSGLGCPDWPTCADGSIAPTGAQAEGWHKWIEFGNRTLTGVVLITALAALLAAILLARRGRSRRAVPWSAFVVAGVLAQALIGGVTVLTGLHPWTVSLHFLVSMLLVAASTVAFELTAPDPPRRPVRAEVRWLAGALVAVAAVVLILGTMVTGSGPHAGDADTPRLGLDPRAISWLHADAVMLFLGLSVAMMIGLRLTDAASTLQRRGVAIFAVTIAQGVVGYVQYALGLPEVLVAVHMFGACALVVVVARLATPMARRQAHAGVPAGPTFPDQIPRMGSSATAANSSVR